MIYQVEPDVLRDYFSRHFPERVQPEIQQVERINDGWECDVYSLKIESGVESHRQVEDLILRIYPGNESNEKAYGEHHILKMMRDAGYPIPAVYHLERENSPFGKAFILMEKINGRSLWPVLYGEKDPAKKQQWLSLFCKLFVDLHRIDWRKYVDNPQEYEPGTPSGIIDRQFARFQPLIDNYPTTGLVRVWEWLQAEKPHIVSTKASPVHWDFHPKNILVCDDGSGYVIDWTSIDITDFRFDLAWTLLLINAYESGEAREDMLREYERQAGAPVEQFAFFEVAACIRRLLSIIVSIKYGADKLGMRPGAEDIMRQQIGPTGRTYALLHERTGIVMPEVEELLK